MTEAKSFAIEECEKTIPLNDKILAGTFNIIQSTKRRSADSLFEEHSITIEWMQTREIEQKSNVSYYEDIRFKLKQFLMNTYDISPSLSEKTVDEMFKRGTEFISLEEQKESEK